MNKKVNYVEAMSRMTPEQYRFMSVLVSRNEEFADRVFADICSQEGKVGEAFFGMRNMFKYWFIEYTPASEPMSHLDMYLIQTITRTATAEKYVDVGVLANPVHMEDWILNLWNCEARTSKGVRFTQIHKIYVEFCRFLETGGGQDFLFNTELSALGADEYDKFISSIEDTRTTPFYDTFEYRMQMVNACGKKVIRAVTHSVTQNVLLNILWHMMFEGGKLNYTEAIRRARTYISEKSMSDSTLRRTLKKLDVALLEELLKGDTLETYFNGCSTSIDGKIYTFRDAIEHSLADARTELTEEQKIADEYYIDTVAAQDAALAFCRATGIKEQHWWCCAGHSQRPDGIIVKMYCDANFKKHKRPKIVIFQSGGWIDFSTGRTGFISQLIPHEYFYSNIKFAPRRQRRTA